jgi:C-terminal processing protease CtpA/Prc
MTSKELFYVCADMLNELRDGHTNLSATFNTSYYRKWWSDYPENYSERLVEQYYLNFNYLSAGGLDYAILPENVGYIRYSSFSSAIGEGNLDEALMHLNTCVGLIIDVRDNGGGSMSNVETFVRRFITENTLVGYISHKTGPGHNDFSEPKAYYFDPAESGRIMWGKPTVVLTSRGTYSAANNFVSIMKYIPSVSIVGSCTGGGSGMPFSSELPNGWGVRFSACSVLDCKGNTTEFGVEPTEGCAIDLDASQALLGHDTILDFAIARLCNP